jgi:hypothetical protein
MRKTTKKISDGGWFPLNRNLQHDISYLHAISSLALCYVNCYFDADIRPHLEAPNYRVLQVWKKDLSSRNYVIKVSNIVIIIENILNQTSYIHNTITYLQTIIKIP